MLADFRAASSTPLVVCRLPTPLGADWRSVLRRPRVRRLGEPRAVPSPQLSGPTA